VSTTRVDEGELVRRLVGEAWILVGPVPCSILLQLARPEIAAGVRDHSTFRAHPMRRARHTVEFVYGLAFGTPQEAEAVSGRVRAVHRRVKGPGYSAEDPSLQTWVAATGLVSYRDGHERLFGPLSEQEREVLVSAFGLWATSLGCPAEHWPQDMVAFERYWEEELAGLEVSEDARAIACAMFRPRQWWLRPLTSLQRFFTTGLLPDAVRRQYRLAWGPARRRSFGVAMAALAAVYPRLPPRLRQAPQEHYLRGLRRRLERPRGAASPRL
jgi:uncharacterized protein (DUF2236 family)